MEKILRMSNREGECFFLLLAKAAEYGARGYYKLYEIAREAYDKLVREIVDEETAVDLIREGRILFETDEDANGRGYCIVHDEKYQELAPWSSAKRKYERIYGR